MAVELNHHIIWARDADASARFLCEMLGLPAPRRLGPFAVVTLGATSLDFHDHEGEIATQHYAFLVSEREFDEVFGRIRERGMPYWADPYRRQKGEINGWDDGRGVYFDDPDGHLLEILTRPYGSAGTAAEKPHPLIAPEVEPGDGAARQAGDGANS